MSDQYKPLRVISDVPRSSLLHPERQYVPAARTDVAETFRRARERMTAEAAPENVRTIRRRKA